MSTGETVAVKVLATHSKQGENEFKAEVFLLGRLHHRNLVNLVGYCAEKGQHMLVYVYMPNGSLASHLYSEHRESLSWDLRITIALDIARGLEYLHEGAIPPVVHRDIKSSNILLDRSLRARVADFGLSREEMVTQNASIRGTYGYLDPEYVSSRSFTKKSDVYSFGVLMFELIAGRTPEQGLLEYVELVYVVSKFMTEEKAFQFAKENGIDLVSIIPPTVAGPFLTPTVPASIQVLLSPLTGDPNLYPILVTVHSRLGSIPLVHIEDLCNAQIFLMEKNAAEGRYICSASSSTMPQLAKLLSEKYPSFSSERYEKKFHHKAPSVISSNKLTNLGFEFKHSIKDIVEQSIASCTEYGYL